MIALVAAAFAFNLWLAQPDVAALVAGILPSAEIGADATMLLLATGIIGATVMPHNLYLHSALVQSRNPGAERRSAIRYATADSCIALVIAMAINCSLLVLAASAFHARGAGGVAELSQAYELLSPMLGTSLAATAFAVALLACGVSSTVTGTIAGQVVMEGFLELRLPPWLRRLATRAVAIVPAVIAGALYGESGIARLLVASQVVLSLQLPFAVIPLVAMTGSRRVMGAHVAPAWMAGAAWLLAGLIVAVNVLMLYQVFLG
jgi:manganese transport protein